MKSFRVSCISSIILCIIIFNLDFSLGSKLSSCAYNQDKLLNAITKYESENQVFSLRIKGDDIFHLMLRDGYLKDRPICEGKNTYHIRRGKSGFEVFCEKHGALSINIYNEVINIGDVSVKISITLALLLSYITYIQFCRLPGMQIHKFTLFVVFICFTLSYNIICISVFHLSVGSFTFYKELQELGFMSVSSNIGTGIVLILSFVGSFFLIVIFEILCRSLSCDSSKLRIFIFSYFILGLIFISGGLSRHSNPLLLVLAIATYIYPILLISMIIFTLRQLHVSANCEEIPLD